jgi:hypothetical protein
VHILTADPPAYFLEADLRDRPLVAAMRRRSAIATRTVADTVAADWIDNFRTLNEL